VNDLDGGAMEVAEVGFGGDMAGKLHLVAGIEEGREIFL
jgi:hypothetical protein